MATEREDLEKAIADYTGAVDDGDRYWPPSLILLRNAARKYAETLPMSEDYAIIGRNSREVFIYKALGTQLMSESEANGRATLARKEFPNTTYTVVKVPT